MRLLALLGRVVQMAVVELVGTVCRDDRCRLPVAAEAPGRRREKEESVASGLTLLHRRITVDPSKRIVPFQPVKRSTPRSATTGISRTTASIPARRNARPTPPRQRGGVSFRAKKKPPNRSPGAGRCGAPILYTAIPLPSADATRSAISATNRNAAPRACQVSSRRREIHYAFKQIVVDSAHSGSAGSPDGSGTKP